MAETLDASGLTPAHIRACRESIRLGSKSFFAASLILPRRQRNAASALYAFCRLSDDVADAPCATHASIDGLEKRLAAAYRNRAPACSIDEAFARVVDRYAIPRSVPASMLEGFRWDIDGRRYETLGDLTAYAARVAGTVGVMMTLIMGRNGAATLARACDLGVAMQLTNIARDVGEDARNGRLYLPRQWLREEGICPDAFLSSPIFTPALARVVARLLNEADTIYARSLTGLADLPLSCRPGIRTAGLVYAEIGQQVRANGYDSVSRRAHTSGRRKMALLARGCASSLASTVAGARCDDSPTLVETAYLVEATARAQTATMSGGEWFFDLVARLNERDTALVAHMASNGTSSTVSGSSAQTS